MNGIFKRIAFLYKLFVLIAIAVIGKIIYLQFISPTETTATDISFRDEILEANRGNILARDGRPLATSVPYYRIRMDCTVSHPDTFNKYIDALSGKLAAFFKDKPARAYKQEIEKARKEGKRYKALGNRLVDYAELETIKKFPLFRLGTNRGGILSEKKYKRNNPYGRLAYRTIGFINTEGVGVGIEGSCDYYLKGTPGHQTIQRMLGGEWRPVNSEESVPPKDGYDIQTTIDIDIQEAAENALKEQLSKSDNIEGATALVMEVSTGAIRAIANMKKDGKGGFDESYNYAIGEATEPGSTFKLVTLVALIEDGYVTLNTPVDAGNGRWDYAGYTYTDTHPNGLLTVQKAFEKSSNISFAKLAVEYYGKNEKKFVDRVQSMKLGERFNLDIQGEARASIYAPGDAMWSRSSLSSMAIGYATLLTPLHTLTFYNAIANGGKMMKPYFIENYQQDGEIIKQFEPQEISGAICSKRTVETVKKALRGVVTDGTGRTLNNDRYQISGKSGTARMSYGKYGYEKNGYRKYQASFAGFFPSEDPKYSAIVILYSGDTRGNFYGATWAGPVFKQIADHIYTSSTDWQPVLEGKQMKTNTWPDISAGKSEAEKTMLAELPIKGAAEISRRLDKRGWVRFAKDSSGITVQNLFTDGDSLANVVDMGLKDALYLLENQGYKVKFSGWGRVIRQDPPAGSKPDKNTVINLQLTENGTD